MCSAITGNLITEWQIKYGVSDEALLEFYKLFQPNGTPHDDGKSESATSKACELMSAKYGARLWRNNSGATKDENGRMIRYGLGNTSKRINDVMKSSDYIGFVPRLITPEMVGTRIAQFMALEMKKPNWKLIPSDKRGQAQANFGSIVSNGGGIFSFISAPEQFMEIMNNVKQS